MFRCERHVAGAADRGSVLEDRERVIGPGKHGTEPRVDVADAHPAPDRRVGAGFPQAVCVLGTEGFERDDPALEPVWKTFPHGRTLSTLSERCPSTSSSA